jgi:hypothetical protein
MNYDVKTIIDASIIMIFRSVQNKIVSLDYRRLNRYDIMKVGEVSKLIFPLHRSENNWFKYCLNNDETIWLKK